MKQLTLKDIFMITKCMYIIGYTQGRAQDTSIDTASVLHDAFNEDVYKSFMYSLIALLKKYNYATEETICNCLDKHFDMNKLVKDFFVNKIIEVVDDLQDSKMN